MDLQTLKKIDFIKTKFENELKNKMKLVKVPSPLFFLEEDYLNDTLNGVEKPVSFEIDGIDCEAEIIHSLAKWKRVALKKYKFKNGNGIFADMRAIRRNEILDKIHSCLVDQWDWEKIISKNQRTISTLKSHANKVYKILLETQKEYNKKFKSKNNIFLPEKLFCITSQKLEDMYPNLSPKERENKICKEHKAVLLIGIGGKLKSGIPHDGRSPEYDDWSMNGDILLWNETLKQAFEISSMGVRVDSNSIKSQLETVNKTSNFTKYQEDIINNKLPFTIGGGIGQSRVCMYVMQTKHIGEVQSSVWPKEVKKNSRIL